jgi:hypothetical protein
MSWTEQAMARVRHEPTAVHDLFPVAHREATREGRDGESVRGDLLAAAGWDRAELTRELQALYWGGDTAEKKAVLAALPLLDEPERPNRIGDDALPLVRDALRSNDTRLVAAALGPYSATYLDDHTWRQAVMKCLFAGIPVVAIAGLAHRADAELRRMALDFAAERTAAGRIVPDDVAHVLSLSPSTPTSSDRSH